MGRVKLKIKKLENTSGRQVTYSKRRAGILKKARELSILCDVDVVLLMFSPMGKPTLCLGEHSNIEGIVMRYAQLTPQERAKRKLENLEALKKAFKKSDHDVNIEDFLGASTETIEEFNNQSQLLQAQLAEVHKRLSYWVDPGNINNIDEVRAMEDSLKESLSRIRAHKFQNGMHLPLGIGCEQAQPISWLHDHDGPHMMLPEDQSLVLSHRDMACPECVSFSSFSEYFGSGKQKEIDMSKPEAGLNELRGNACLRLQPGDQYPYQSYGGNILSETKFKADMEMDLQGSHMDYQVHGFELPRLGYTDSSNWAATSEHCAISLFDDYSYPQQPN